MGIRGKYIFEGIGNWGKWALVQRGTKANGHLGKGVGEGGIISDKICFCDSGARLRMRNYQLFVQNCDYPLTSI